jgi:hypothetical protein
VPRSGRTIWKSLSCKSPGGLLSPSTASVTGSHEGLSPASVSRTASSTDETSANVPNQGIAGSSSLASAWRFGQLMNRGVRLFDDPVVARTSRHLRQHLIENLHQQLPTHTLEQVVDAYISLFMEHRFPATPICHELSLRTNTSLRLSESNTDYRSPANQSEMETESNVSLPSIRSFTLLTALCALTSYTVAEDVLPGNQQVGPLFFHVSQEMLNLHQEYEIEHPDWVTLAIWILHACSLYTIGKTQLAGHFLAQARWAVQELRLWDECSFQNLDPVTAQLLRYQFALIFIADKSTSIIRDKPIVLHEVSLQQEITAQFQEKQRVYMLDPSREVNQSVFEEKLMEAYDIGRRMWSAAADLIIDIRDTTRTGRKRGAQEVSNADLLRLRDLYVHFTSILDDLPIWLQNPDYIRSSHPEVSHYQVPRFWGRRADLFVAFHCLKLIILRHCIEQDVPAVLGLNHDVLMLALRKSELAQEFMGVVEGVPFGALQANGEACVSQPLNNIFRTVTVILVLNQSLLQVETIRQVCLVLLDLIQNIQSSHIHDRAKICFARLLDILARLDSRVSEKLSNELGERGV